MKHAKITFSIACFLFLSAFPALAQSGKVTRKKSLLLDEYRYLQNGKKMSEKVFLEQLAANTEAYDLMKNARENKVWGSVIGSAGSALFGAWVGAQFGSNFSPKENDFGESKIIPVLGANLIGISVPLRINYKKGSKRAMQLYNDGFAETNAANEIENRIVFTGSGLGFQVQF